MNYFILLLIGATTLFACTENTKEGELKLGGKNGMDTGKLTTVQWIDSIQNFGEVTEGEMVNITFHFKNTGNVPLIVQDVKAACGCTVPSYSKEPIAPGKEGTIDAQFDSQNQHDNIYKTVSVFANTAEQKHILIFKGSVKK